MFKRIPQLVHLQRFVCVTFQQDCCKSQQHLNLFLRTMTKWWVQVIASQFGLEAKISSVKVLVSFVHQISVSLTPGHTRVARVFKPRND
jgi:hypothetical protein